ncbi:MAG: preprotein translocase subunit SecG [Mangrovibacterium sp.]
MYTLITVLLIIASVFMVLIVLVQNSKGGGLASNFQSSNQVMGVRKTNDFLDKATWWLAGALLILSIAGSAFIPKESKSTVGTEMSTQIENAIDPSAVPSFPSADQTTPASQTPAEDADQN